MNIYVGNLSYTTAASELRKAFERFGQVSRVSLITDRDSGQPRGFGFVEMPARIEAQAAIDGLNGVEFGGRSLMVNEARPRTPNGQGNSRDQGNGRGGNRSGNFNRKGW